MPERTSETTVTFRRPFDLAGVDGRQPAGVYRLTVDEEEILGLSFLAYRRVATWLHTPSLAATGGTRQIYVVEPTALAAALEADAMDAPTP